MREGTVVVVAGQFLDKRIRENNVESMKGTLVGVHKDKSCVVLLENHDLWYGKVYDLTPDQESEFEDEAVSEFVEADSGDGDEEDGSDEYGDD